MIRTLFAALVALFLLPTVASAGCVATSLASGQYLQETPSGGAANDYNSICDNISLADYQAAIDPYGNFYLYHFPTLLECDPTAQSCPPVAIWGYYGGQGSFLYMDPGGILYFYGPNWVVYGEWGSGPGGQGGIAGSKFTVERATPHMAVGSISFGP